MADFGIGEAAAAEGAKTAGEAAASEAAASEAAASEALAGSGALGGEGYAATGLADAAIPSGTAAASTIAGDSVTKAALYGAEGYGPAATQFELAGGQAGLMSDIGTGLKYANEANNINNFAENPNLQTGLNLGLSTSSIVPSTASSAPIGTGGESIPGVSDPLTAPSASPTPTGSPTTGIGGTGVDPAVSSAPNTGPSLDKALNWMGDNKLQTANLGLGTASLLNNIRQGNMAQKQYQNVAAGSKAASDQLLAQFKSGQLTGADSFAIADWTQKQKAATDQYFAKAGLSNSSMHQQALLQSLLQSMHQQALQQIDTQAEGMRQQAVQSLLTNGLSAAGVSDPTLRAGITAGLQNDQASMKAMQDFLGTLAKMNTPQASQTGTPGG